MMFTNRFLTRNRDPHAIHLLDQLHAMLKNNQQPNPVFFTRLTDAVWQTLPVETYRRRGRRYLRALECAVARRNFRGARTPLRLLLELLKKH